MVNERFPHRIKVTRVEENPNYNPSLDPDGSPTIPIVIYESICQSQINEVGDTVRKENVFFSDHTAYMPYPDYTEDNPFGDRSKSTLIKKLDKVEVFDGVRAIIGQVSQFEAGNIGIRVWYDEE